MIEIHGGKTQVTWLEYQSRLRVESGSQRHRIHRRSLAVTITRGKGFVQLGGFKLPLGARRLRLNPLNGTQVSLTYYYF